MKELILKASKYWLSEGQIDSIDETEDSIYWTIGAISGFKYKWNREFKDDLFDESCNIEFNRSFENVTVMELDNDKMRVLAFDDGYEGFELVLVNKGGKMALESYREVGDEECNVHGMDGDVIYEFIK